MSKHEQFPQNPEQNNRARWHYRQYENTETSFYADEPGAVIQLGLSSTFKHSRNYGSGDAALIHTASGNKYGIYRGWAINYNAKKAARLPDGGYSFDEAIRIGDRWKSPTGDHTTQVMAVEMVYKSGTRQPDAEQILEPSPFEELRSIVFSLEDNNPSQ